MRQSKRGTADDFSPVAHFSGVERVSLDKGQIREQSSSAALGRRVRELEGELEALRQELQAAREKQRAGDEVFRRFSDCGILGIAMFEAGGKLLFANEALQRMIGCQADEITAGQVSWDQLTPPEWASRTREVFDELQSQGSCAPYETEYLRRNGSRFWGLFTGVVMDGQNRVAFLLDITERKKAEEALRFQARLLDAVEQAVIATDLDGTILHWNQFAERLYGWPSGEVAGRSILDVTPAPCTRERGAAVLAQLRRGESWSGEFLSRRRDGSMFVAWITNSPIFNPVGSLIGIIGVSLDITDRMQFEEERSRLLTLEQQARTRAEEAQRLHQTVEQKLTLLTEATGTLIGSLNRDRVLAEVLALSRRLVAADAYAVWRQDQTTGRWGIATADGLSEPYQSAVIASLQHGQAMPGTPLVVSDIDAEPLLAAHRGLLREEGIRSMLVLPLVMHGAINGTLVFYHREPHRFDDIELKVSGALANMAASAMATTDLYEAASQRTDQLIEADRLKDQFLAMLAHELRNPLGAIRNAIQVVQRSQPGSGAFQRAQAVLDRQSEHMTRLVDELLDVSRISRGKIALHPARLDLAALIRETCEDYRRVLEAAAITLTAELPVGPLWVSGDGTRLGQALGNLLQNAAKFTDAGGVVRVRLVVEGSAVVTVSDTGIGISTELLPRLFEPFIQADRSLDRTKGGLGLGLALVKGIVELHGGRVHAHSDGIGCGSTFAFELPLAEEPGETEEQATPSATGDRSCRVLIIEDNADAAETLRDLLEFAGHQVEIAYTGPSGVELARRIRPQVVLCDIGLPGMDGYAVAAVLRQDPATAHARLIAISGYAQEDDRRRSSHAGFEAHLMKPVEPALLHHLLLAS